MGEEFETPTVNMEKHRIRYVKIYFYLEDDSIQVIEPTKGRGSTNKKRHLVNVLPLMSVHVVSSWIPEKTIPVSHRELLYDVIVFQCRHLVMTSFILSRILISEMNLRFMEKFSIWSMPIHLPRIF